jgi:hypothetical protein
LYLKNTKNLLVAQHQDVPLCPPPKYICIHIKISYIKYVLKYITECTRNYVLKQQETCHIPESVCELDVKSKGTERHGIKRHREVVANRQYIIL